MKSPYTTMLDQVLASGMPQSPPPTKRWGLFDAEGAPKGFWSNDVFEDNEDGSRNDAIPAEAVEITDEVWMGLINNQPWARYIDGAVVIVEPPPPPPPVPNPTLIEAQQANQRLDDGVTAAAESVSEVSRMLRAMPRSTEPPTREEFDALHAQVQELSDAVKAMLTAQQRPTPKQ